MIYSRHTLSHCNLCETDMVICADCDNNCCNGGTGEVNGKRCGCKEAYEHQDVLFEGRKSIKFAKNTKNAD